MMIQLKDGFQMNYEVIPAVLPEDTLFIHGNLASNAWWRPALGIWKDQAESNYHGRAILAEWRGCGDSGAPKSETELSIRTMADDYNSLIDAIGIKNVCVVGHSTGGLIALAAMAKRPDLYRRAFLLDTVGAQGKKWTDEGLAGFAAMGKSRDICSARLGATILGNNFDGSLFQRLLDDACRVSHLNWVGVPKALGQIDLRSELKKIAVPVTVAHGSHDHTLPIEDAREVAESLPNATFIELKNQGHCMNIENPEGFVAYVNQSLYAN